MRLQALFLSTLLFASGATATEVKAPVEPATVYVVRHAEKEGEKGDVPLTKDGEKRAETLAQLLHDVPLKTVYSTDTKRTRSTGRPTAQDQELRVTVYDPGKTSELVDTLLASGGHHLVVGHSNTVPDLVESLGGDGGSAIGHHEYDRLYVVHRAGAQAATSLLRYGEPTAREKE